MSLIRNVVLGNRPRLPRLEFKYAMLRGEFAMIIIAVGLFYIGLDSFNRVYVFLPWYILMIILSVISMAFNRWRRYALSNIVIVFIVNFIVFLFADVDHPFGGVYFYFIASSMAGLILFSHSKPKAGLFFALLPIGLGFMAFFGDLDLLPPPLYIGDVVKINFISNFTIGLLSVIFMLQFLLSQNRESEQSLVEQNELL